MYSHFWDTTLGARWRNLTGMAVWRAVGTGLVTALSLFLFQTLKIESRSRTASRLDCMKPYFAEFLGTFALVFAGTGAIVINQASGGVISHVGIALTFGLVVLAMIYAVG